MTRTRTQDRCTLTDHYRRIPDSGDLCGEMSPAPADRAEGPGHHRHEPAAADARADAAHHVPLHVDLQHRHHLHDGTLQCTVYW